MTQIGETPIRLQLEVQAARRRRRANILSVVAFTLVIGGLFTLTTEWFGTGLIVAVVGFALACLAEEMGR